jgi:hypothetical protein
MMPVKLTPQEAAEKWQRRLTGATADIQKGVERVTVAPTQKAVAKEQKLRQRWQESMDSGKWRANTAAVSLEDWRSAMINKGVQRISQGASSAQGKVADVYQSLFAYENNVMSQIESMPDVTIGDSIARASAWIEKMHGFKRR